MKHVLAALVAFSFISTSGAVLAQDKKEPAKTAKGEKATKEAKKDGAAAPKKKKKEGC